MKAKELRGKSTDELKKIETTLAEEIFRLRMKRQLGQTGSPVQMRRARQELARVKMLQTVRTANT